MGRDVHCLVNIMPSGQFLMEDFFEAGGLPVVIRELAERGLIHKNAMTVNGGTIWENNQEARNWKSDVIYPFETPFKRDAGIAVLRGNLAPDGAVIKPSAASPHLMRHTGRAVVFESIEDLHGRINDEALDIDENCVMVLKYCGPKGYPGMAEVGNMPLPPKLLKRGINDIVRISDARMSGTAYGTVVLHAAPEAAAGGTAGAGAERRSDHARRRSAQPAPSRRRRRAARRRSVRGSPPEPHATRGYVKLYLDHVMQANDGADMDFLVGKSGAAVGRDNH